MTFNAGFKIKNMFLKMRLFKNIARTPISTEESYLKYGFAVTKYEKYLCPRCKSVLNAGPSYQPQCCNQCGQKMNFADVKWKEEKALGYAERRTICEPIKN